MFVRTTEHVPIEVAGPPALGERGFEIRQRERDEYRLDLWGRLHPGWADPLFRGLHRAGLSVERGFARRTAAAITEDVWSAAFQLRGNERSADPLLLDFLSLVGRGRPKSRIAPELTGFTIEPSPRHGGCLRLEVSAEDHAGFLGGVLQRITGIGLLPVEMRVDTDGGGVHDEFYVVTRAGAQPDAEDAKRIQRALAPRPTSSLRSSR